jgi:predicted O-methyltransferase YrrM
VKHLFLIFEYIKYRLKASTAHGIHSPFVYDFIAHVLKDKRHFYAFDSIEKLRKNLYKNKKKLHVEDFGAGSLRSNFKQRKVCDIARTAGRNEKFGKLLFRIANYYNAQTILELGTSLGIGTSYLASANQKANVITIEGSAEIAKEAKLNFQALHCSNITQHIGNFDDVYSSVIAGCEKPDFIFIDGNHRKQPTIDYFLTSLPFLKNNSIIIFDDIHWTKDMLQAWDTIRHHESVTLSIDLFFFGIVFFSPDFKVKQHFVLIY